MSRDPDIPQDASEALARLLAEAASRTAIDPRTLDAYLAARRLDHDLRRAYSPAADDEAFIRCVLDGCQRHRQRQNQNQNQRQTTARFISGVMRRSAAVIRPPAGKRRLRLPMWSIAGAALAAGVVILVGLLLLVSGGATERIATLDAATTSVRTMRDGRVLAAASGMALHSGDAIEVMAEPVGTSAGITYPDGSRMTLLAGTRIRLWNEGGAKRVHLDQGDLVCTITPQATGRAMKLFTAEADAEVVGTSFSLHAGPGLARLNVTEGAVSFRGKDGSTRIVRGGEMASATAAPPLPSQGVLIDLDFEDGAQSRFCQEGQIGPAPQGGGSRNALAGSQLDPQTGGKVRIGVAAGQSLFAYADDLELHFDYWVDDSARSIDVWCWDDSQETTFGTTGSGMAQASLHNLRSRTWTSLTIPLNGWRRDTGGSMQPGDLIRHLSIQVEQHGAALFIDNLQIRRSRSF